MFIFQPKDFIAVMVVASYVGLKTIGLDGGSEAALFLILGYYFAKRANGQDNGK